LSPNYAPAVETQHSSRVSIFLGRGFKAQGLKENIEPWPRPGLPGPNDRRPGMVEQYKQVQAQSVSRQGGPQNVEGK